MTIVWRAARCVVACVASCAVVVCADAWEYRVEGKAGIKSCVPLPNGRVEKQQKAERLGA